MSWMAKLKWRIAQKLEFKWWQHYLKDKVSDEYLDWKKSYWSSLFQNYNIEFKSSVLEIGSGPAGAFIIAKQDQQYVCVDPLTNHYQNKLSIFSKDDYSFITFENKPWETYENASEFETVFAFNALNHFQNLELSINKIKRNLSDTGVFILSVDVHKSKIAKMIFNLIPADLLHPQQYTLKEYLKVLSNSGLIVKEQHLLKSNFIFDYYLIKCSKEV